MCWVSPYIVWSSRAMLTPPHALAPLAVLELYPLQAPLLAHGVIDPMRGYLRRWRKPGFIQALMWV
ncbi:MAG: hypothetical protein ACO2O2_12120 [Acidilobaceae archaeon]